MNSSRPYLVRVLHEWIVDNDYTPYILANAKSVGVKVSSGYASSGQTILNVSPSAARHLHTGNEVVSFKGCFGGVAQSLYIPALAVMAIYARENGQGMALNPGQPGPVDDEPGDDDGGPSGGPSRPSGRPPLKVVK